jgi:transcriptional regulator GlxA family with amidase domain
MEPASMTVRRLAGAAGVSRQHLTRVFRQVIGMSPKRYCRLARFQAGLAYADAGARVKWPQVAAELGYADQSHMIAEFRELSSLTPEALATQRWFHPFILDARARVLNP